MTEPSSRKPGRPKGTGGPIKAEADKQTRHTVTMTDELWAYCTAQPGGAAAFLRELIEQARRQAKG